MEIVYTVLYDERVLRDDIPGLGATIKKRIQKTIAQKLTTSPQLFGKPLRGQLHPSWALRVGDHRVLYEIKGSEVWVWAIRHRSEAYILKYLQML